MKVIISLDIPDAGDSYAEDVVRAVSRSGVLRSLVKVVAAEVPGNRVDVESIMVPAGVVFGLRDDSAWPSAKVK